MLGQGFAFQHSLDLCDTTTTTVTTTVTTVTTVTAAAAANDSTPLAAPPMPQGPIPVHRSGLLCPPSVSHSAFACRGVAPGHGGVSSTPAVAAKILLKPAKVKAGKPAHARTHAPGWLLSERRGDRFPVPVPAAVRSTARQAARSLRTALQALPAIAEDEDGGEQRVSSGP